MRSGTGYFVYIVTNRRDGTLYIGVTNDLVRRVWEHRTGAVPGFTKRYNLSRLVWFEQNDDVRAAIQREKTLKRWYRKWKVALIEDSNPEWRDMFPDITDWFETEGDRRVKSDDDKS